MRPRAAHDDSSASNAPNKKARRKAAKGIKRKTAKQKMAAQAAQAQDQGNGIQGQNVQNQGQPRGQGVQETIPSATANGPGRDPVIPPSAESGGTPDPHPTYLAHAALPPTRLSSPRTILIVMDLNGTLLFRPDRRKSHNFVQRPHAGPFMEYCIDVFRVAVWSSARPQNVAIMCEQLLGPERRGRLVASWGRDRFGLSHKDYNSRVQCYKRLQSVWADPAIQASHPEAATGGRWDQSNTVLVDDSAEKARTEPHNLLRIPEYGGNPVEGGDVLPQVHDYLNELSWQSDVSRFIRLNPFRLDTEYRLPPQDADAPSIGQ
jgi:hypothetical protein